MCNVVKIEDSLQHYDIPDRAAVDMLNAFSPPPVSNTADSEPDRSVQDRIPNAVLVSFQCSCLLFIYFTFFQQLMMTVLLLLWYDQSVERARTVDGNHSSRVWRRHYSKNRPTDTSNYEGR